MALISVGLNISGLALAFKNLLVLSDGFRILALGS